MIPETRISPLLVTAGNLDVQPGPPPPIHPALPAEPLLQHPSCQSGKAALQVGQL